MHVPDGFINAPVSVAAGVVAAGAVAVEPARRPASNSDERTAPLAGLVAAFIFAVQMLNFPVAAGTSGHLLGGALAAILVGPYTGVLCVSVVLLMQGILFADGGLTALGVNITVMGVVTVRRRLRRSSAGCVKVLPRTRRSVTVAVLRRRAALRARRGRRLHAALRDRRHHRRRDRQGPHRDGRRPCPDRHRRGRDHRATVGAVIAVRPDLVHGARGLTAAAEAARRRRARSTRPAAEPAPAAGRRPRPPPQAVWLAGLGHRPRPAPGSSASTPPPAPTGWRRSPPTRASTRRSRTTPPRTPRSPTTASRTSPTPGSPAASRASSASASTRRRGHRASSGRVRRRADRRRRPPRPRTAVPRDRLTWAPGHAHKLYRHGALARARPAAALQARRRLRLRPRRRRRRRARRCGPSGCTRVLLAAVAAAARVPAGFLLRRLLIEVPFVAFAVLMPFVAQGERVEVLGLSLSVSRAVGRLERPRQGHPRRRRLRPPRLDHRAARTAPRPPAAQTAAAARPDRVLHDPLRRRHHRRDAPDADRARVARLRGARRAALGRARQVGRGAVHPLLRARRAGPSGHGQPGVRRAPCRSSTR